MLRKNGRGVGLALAVLLGLAGAARAADTSAFEKVGAEARAPIGWIDFCNDHPADCQGTTSAPRDIVMTQATWRDLLRVNRWVNDNVKPMTDLDHYGVIEKWAYPVDGYGDCEDYVLQKRKMLIEAGWPRDALLITVVRDKKGDGHAVLTVASDKGDFILDNQTDEVVLWHDTGYRFVKRQSQSNVNVWVSLGEERPAISAVSAR